MRAAIVTGSTSGIGQKIAEKLAKEGFDVLINGFGELEKILGMCSEMSKIYGVKVIYHAADLANANEIKEMISHAYELFGRIDVLVNNAGMQFVSSVDDFPDDKWQQIIDVDLTACFHAIKHCLPIMKKNSWGRIINISSVHGVVASINKAAYVAAKHGLVGLGKVVALENAKNGITCNTICPGWVLTALLQKQIDALALKDGLSNEEATIKIVGEKQPTHRMTKPESVADMVYFLTTEAAENMTGSSITMDGGWTVP